MLNISPSCSSCLLFIASWPRSNIHIHLWYLCRKLPRVSPKNVYCTSIKKGLFGLLYSGLHTGGFHREEPLVFAVYCFLETCPSLGDHISRGLLLYTIEFCARIRSYLHRRSLGWNSHIWVCFLCSGGKSVRTVCWASGAELCNFLGPFLTEVHHLWLTFSAGEITLSGWPCYCYSPAGGSCIH